MPINAHPEYIAAEGKFLKAETDEERLTCLDEMLKTAPKHKGAENLLKQLRIRKKKLLEKIEKSSKGKGGGKAGIKKEHMQAALIGVTNTGKSSLLKALTKAQPQVGDFAFTTKYAEQGMMPFGNVQIQLVEIPAIESEYFDRGIVHTADTIVALLTDMSQIKPLKEILEKLPGKVMWIWSKADLLSKEELRKKEATLKSKKIEPMFISTFTKEGIEEFKNKLFLTFGKCRVYAKEPSQTVEEARKIQKPVVLDPTDTIKQVAEKVFRTKNPESIIKEIKIWGPSSKFPGQIVGVNHTVKDLDVVEFKTR